MLLKHTLQQEFGKILVQCDHQIGTHFLIIISIPTSRISVEVPIFEKSGSGTTALNGSFEADWDYIKNIPK